MLQEQSERLDSLKDVVYDVQLSLVKNLALAGLDEKRECRIKKNVSQAIERVHQLRRHLNTCEFHTLNVSNIKIDANL